MTHYGLDSKYFWSLRSSETKNNEFLVIDTKKEGLKEVYVISDYENPKSPVIIHFILVNDTFRQFSSPDVPRAQGRV